MVLVYQTGPDNQKHRLKCQKHRFLRAFYAFSSRFYAQKMVYFKQAKKRLGRNIEDIKEWQNMAIKLRDYQEEALNSVIKDFQGGVHHQLIVLPTASGKTFVMAAIAKHFNKRVLLVAHREELLQQAEEKFKLYWPEVDIGICKAERKEFDHQIVIGSVQTCCRPNCLKQLKKNGFDILLIDETHHASADTYQKIITELGFGDKTEKLLIGVTATPMRSDKKQLGDFFDKMVYSKTAGDLIQAGYLSLISGRRILTSFNLNKVRTRMGDFAVNELASVVNTKDRNKFIVEKFIEHCPTRKAIAFCVDVKHCQDLAQVFNTQNITTEPVWGTMDKKPRKEVLGDFSAGKIQVVTSCGVLTEGFDEPSIQAIVMARPTKSKGLYIQMAGRGLRKYPGKDDCLVLDFTDQYHNLNSVITLNKAIPEAKYIDENKPKIERPKVDRTPRINTLKDVDYEFDVLGISTNYFWINIGDDERSLTDDNKNEIVIRPTDSGFCADLFSNGRVTSLCKNRLKLKECIKICEDYASNNLKITYAALNGSWLANARKLKPSEKQIEILRQHSINTHWMSKADAYLKIQTIFARSAKEKRLHGNMLTPPQKTYLEQHGLRTDNLTRHDAFVMIQKIKQGESVVPINNAYKRFFEMHKTN